jgi:hypothetical protein
VAASVVVAVVATVAAGLVERPWPALLLGGTAGVLCWAALMGPWLVRLAREARATGEGADPAAELAAASGAAGLVSTAPTGVGAMTAQVATSSPDEGGGA